MTRGVEKANGRDKTFLRMCQPYPPGVTTLLLCCRQDKLDMYKIGLLHPGTQFQCYDTKVLSYIGPDEFSSHVRRLTVTKGVKGKSRGEGKRGCSLCWRVSPFKISSFYVPNRYLASYKFQ